MREAKEPADYYRVIQGWLLLIVPLGPCKKKALWLFILYKLTAESFFY